MSSLYRPAQMIDAHQHLWLPSERRYAWLDAVGPPLDADFGPEDVASDVQAAGVTGTVLVQSADTYEDTFYMLSVAAATSVVRAVVAWVPLDRPSEAEAALDRLGTSPFVRGIRVLNHDYADPRWLLRNDVAAGLDLLVERGLTLDVVSVSAAHLEMLADLATRHPALTIVLDHLGGPPIAGKGWEPWASLLAVAASHPNVSAKLSGLGTASAPKWTWRDWLPYVDHAIRVFGSTRLMVGSDWPVCTLAGDFPGVWLAQRQVIAHVPDGEQDDILFHTANRVYRLGEP